MALDPPEFLARLAHSGVMSADEVQVWNSRLAAGHWGGSLDALAAELVQQGCLTPFQVQELVRHESPQLVLGNYVLVDTLGAGGMGIVYKALHRKMKRLVALKKLSPKGEKFADAVQRFRREIETLAKLNHPNIVVAFDADHVGDVHFLAMELVDGRDLWRTVQQDGPLPVGQALDCIAQAARGLEFAHANKIIHRDIKPSNLLRTRAGLVKILDLGLACPSVPDESSQVGITSTNAVMGTVDFMAPEQAVSTRDADERSDIYSLGMTLHFLLMGRVAYAGDSAIARIIAHREAPIPDLSGTPAVTPAHNQFFRRMVAKRPQDRFQSAGEVLGALSMLVSAHNPPVSTGPPSNPARHLHGDPVVIDAADQIGAEDFSTTKLFPSSEPSDPDQVKASKTDPLPSVAWRQRTAVWWILAAVLLVTLVAGGLIARGFRERDLAQVLPLKANPPVNQGVPAPPRESPGPQADRVPPGGLQEAAVPENKPAAKIKNSVGMELAVVPAGEFLMGSTAEEVLQLAAATANPEAAGMYRSELPQVKVAVAPAFYCGISEVTQQEYLTVMGVNPSTFRDGIGGAGMLPLHPVEQVSWQDAVDFCNALSQREKRKPYYVAENGAMTHQGGDGYRLPTDAEWEYACRGGPMAEGQPAGAARPAVLDDCAWFVSNSNSMTNPVRMKRPNALGLFDMQGNVWEWCDNLYVDSHDLRANDGQPRTRTPQRIIRGGSWSVEKNLCRCAARYRYPSHVRSPGVGFRVVWTIPAADQRPAPAKP